MKARSRSPLLEKLWKVCKGIIGATGGPLHLPHGLGRRGDGFPDGVFPAEVREVLNCPRNGMKCKVVVELMTIMEEPFPSLT